MQAPRKRKRLTDEPLPEIEAPHTEEGFIFVCGQGDSGQLGLGNLLDSDDADAEILKPRKSIVGPKGGSKVKQVAAGGMHSVALTAKGEVYTAGVNDEAALGRKTDTKVWIESKLPGKVGEAESWGRVDISTEHGAIVEVSAGDSHTAALTAIGAVWAWGCFRGDSGPWAFAPGVEYGLRPALVYSPSAPTEQIVRISSGSDHILALRRDGSVLSWGYGAQGQLGRIGSRHRAPEKTQLTPGLVPLHRVKGNKGRRVFKAVGISAAAYGSFVVAESGRVAAFGVNQRGQLGLEIEGTTVAQSLVERPTVVAALEASPIRAVSGGKAHSLALTRHGTVLSFGLQTYGRLGRKAADPNSDDLLPPGPVDSLQEAEIRSVVAGLDTSGAVTSEGGAFVWGMGSNYQLAKTKDDDDLVPRKLNLDNFEGSVEKILQISYGGQHTLFLAQSK